MGYRTRSRETVASTHRESIKYIALRLRSQVTWSCSFVVRRVVSRFIILRDQNNDFLRAIVQVILCYALLEFVV